MTETLTEVVDEFTVRDKKFKIVRIKSPKVLDRNLIERLGVEFEDLLPNTEHSSQETGFSDPSFNYCVDFTNVEYIASSAVGKLVSTDKKHMKANRRGLSLSHIKPEIYEVFAIMKLNKLFEIYKTNEDYKKHMGFVPLIEN